MKKFLSKIKKIIKRLVVENELVAISHKKYEILPMHCADRYVYKSLLNWGYTEVEIPKVFDLINGGSVYLRHDAINLYLFKHATVESQSDMVLVDAGVYWPKYYKQTINMERPLDHNLVSYNSNGEVTVRPARGSLKIEKGFSLLGSMAGSWTHFLMELLPKLEFLNLIPERKGIKVLVPDVVDEHVRILIGETLKDMPEIEVLFVPDGYEVRCDMLYWISPVSYLCNHADYTHLTAVVIPKMTRVAIYDLFQRYGINDSSNGYKIYIGRTGVRNLMNGVDVEDIFCKAGYQILYPHQMTFDEKIKCFANATHVAGPASSGFINVLFSKRAVKVLWFLNYERCMDTYMTQLEQEFDNIQHFALIGRAAGESGINSDYGLDLDLLERFALNCDFDKELVKSIGRFKSSKKCQAN